MSTTKITPIPDSLTRTIQLKAPRQRVWQQLASAEGFTKWFAASVDRPFVPGAEVEMVCTGYPPFKVTIVEMTPPERFSWQWHPNSNEKFDLAEPLTTVTFTLEETEMGTRLTVVETGFSRLFEHRRARTYRVNCDGWEEMFVLLQQSLDGDS